MARRMFRLVTGTVAAVTLIAGSLTLTAVVSAQPPVPTCKGRIATVVAQGGVARGTAGDDVIVGSSGADTIMGGLGHDLICGRGGDDVILGGRGSDFILGQKGDDQISGGGGKDQLLGGPGDDLIEGGLGRDREAGGPGTDECWGEVMNCEVERRTLHNDNNAHTEATDLPYGEAGGQALLLDLFEPRVSRRASAPRPAVIFAHGGGFSSGSRQSGVARSYVKDLADRGMVTASISYRLFGSVTAEAIEWAQHDMQAAVRWFRRHADELGIDPSQIFVSGYSAGAIAAAFTNYNPDDVGTSGNPGFASDVAGALPLAGFAAPNIVDAGEPPVRFFQGTDDTTVPPVLPTATCNAASAVGNVCEIRTYDAGHFLEAFHDEILAEMLDFVSSHG